MEIVSALRWMFKFGSYVEHFSIVTGSLSFDVTDSDAFDGDGDRFVFGDGDAFI